MDYDYDTAKLLFMEELEILGVEDKPTSFLKVEYDDVAKIWFFKLNKGQACGDSPRVAALGWSIDYHTFEQLNSLAILNFNVPFWVHYQNRLDEAWYS